MQISRFIKTNWPYLIMTVFIIFVSLLLFMAEKQGEPIKKEVKEEPYKVEFMDKAKLAQRQKLEQGPGSLHHRPLPWHEPESVPWGH